MQMLFLGLLSLKMPGILVCDIKFHEPRKTAPNLGRHNLPPPVSYNVPGKCHPEGNRMLQLAVLNHLSGKPQNYGHGNRQRRASSCFLSIILVLKKGQDARDNGPLLGQT